MKQVVKDIFEAIKYVIWPPAPDPKRFAETPPVGWYGAGSQKADEGDFFRGKEGGFAVGFDGNLMYSDGETAAEQRGEAQREPNGITGEEYAEMLNHVPKLTNVVLAGRIKPYWREGKKYKQIAALFGITEQYVKFFCTCFERAKRNSNAHEVEF